MPNAIYPSALEEFLTGGIDMIGDDIKVAILESGYTYSAADTVVDDLTAIADISPNLGGKSVTAGVFDANDVTLPTVTAGPAIRSLVIFQDTGNTSTDLLIAFMDTLAPGNPIDTIPDGTDIQIVWANGPTRIFRI